jgi:hypothetical protein
VGCAAAGATPMSAPAVASATRNPSFRMEFLPSLLFLRGTQIG